MTIGSAMGKGLLHSRRTEPSSQQKRFKTCEKSSTPGVQSATPENTVPRTLECGENMPLDGRMFTRLDCFVQPQHHRMAAGDAVCDFLEAPMQLGEPRKERNTHPGEGHAQREAQARSWESCLNSQRNSAARFQMARPISYRASRVPDPKM